jgi:hypothetical protein
MWLEVIISGDDCTNANSTQTGPHFMRFYGEAHDNPFQKAEDHLFGIAAVMNSVRYANVFSFSCI